MDYPTTIEGALELADRLVERFRKSQSADDMFAAVLAVVHVVEWDAEWRDAIEGGYRDPAYQALRERLPAWNTLRGVANGLKHVEPQHGIKPGDLSSDDPEWESDNFWMRKGLGVQYLKQENDRVEISELCKQAMISIRSELLSSSC